MTNATTKTQPGGNQDGSETDFQRIGGEDSVRALVEAFYQRMDTLPEAAGIRALHKSDLTETKDVLARYLGEWLGGPTLYSDERGHPRLRQRHLRIPIGPAERDAWLLCMVPALTQTVTDPVVREKLLAFFIKFADWVRNDPANAPHQHQ